VSIPERVGRYRIERKLGEGGMGVVYAAYDEQLDRPLAVKMLAASQQSDQARKRFWREARAAAKVRHPHVCQLYDVAEENDVPFIAMEILEGESLFKRVGRGPLAVQEAIEISLQMLDALAALHDQGIVHRDLKPSNVFLTPQGVKLLDFGLARSVSVTAGTQEATESQLTQAGGIVGTPQYMSPEQFQGEPVDERSDLFSTGVLLFEMLVGTKPFHGTTPVEIFHSILYEQPRALGGSPAVALLDRVIRRALAKSRQDRFASAREMSEALRQAAQAPDSGEASRARRITRLMVLPFRVLRPDPEIDFLGISIPDAISISLAGVESLAVRSSAAAARYAGDAPDLEKIAEEAQVDVVLTGTLVRSGERIRVTSQLLAAPDGTLLWSHTPQVTMQDVFQLHDEIVHRIVEALSIELTARENRMLKKDVPASASAYELYLRGNQIIVQGLRGGDDLSVARGLLERCVEEDSRFAPAWARLGRCYWLIGKGGEGGAEYLAKAESCFEKALELNPELPLAHNLYAQLQPDLGKAQEAMIRLFDRLRSGAAEPELFAALLHACRYCGLLEASAASHERARRLDPQISTSVNQTFYQLGQWDRAKEEMGKGTIYTDALILFEEGDVGEAVRRLKERERATLPGVTRALVTSLRALAEGKREESLDATRRALAHFPDPEGRYYLSRQLSYWGEAEEARVHFERILEAGFNTYRALTRVDPWLSSLRSAAGFGAVLETARKRYEASRAAFLDAGGHRLLGVEVPSHQGAPSR
jgi:serine/threonine protein kinase